MATTVKEETVKLQKNIDRTFEAGKTAEWNAFWDIMQDNGNRVSNQNMYAGRGWTDITFKPKHDVRVVGSGERLFSTSGICDLKGILEREKKTLDTSGATTLYFAFYLASVAYCPTIDCSGITNTNGMQYLLNNCSLLVEVEKIILPDPAKISGGYSAMLQNCKALEKITFEGVINQKSFNMSGSPNLDLTSAKNILTCLADLTGTANEFVYSVKLAQEVWDRLAADGATAPGDITWAEYVDDKGWLT